MHTHTYACKLKGACALAPPPTLIDACVPTYVYMSDRSTAHPLLGTMTPSKLNIIAVIAPNIKFRIGQCLFLLRKPPRQNKILKLEEKVT